MESGEKVVGSGEASSKGKQEKVQQEVANTWEVASGHSEASNGGNKQQEQ